MAQVAALVPAYQPEEGLLRLLEELSQTSVSPILVVDDGSRPECRPLFEQARELPRVRLSRHLRNRGKGAALKTGLAALMRSDEPPAVGCVTLDADGQHRVRDVVRVAGELERHPESLVLGVRDFSRPEIPWRSRFGNGFSCLLFRLLTGRRLKDVQSGLRGIPSTFVSRLLELPSSGYAWEAEVLVACRQLPLQQVEIETIYLDGNRSSHFRPLMDSLRVVTAMVRARLVAAADLKPA